MPEPEPRSTVFKATKITTSPGFAVILPDEFFVAVAALLELDEIGERVLRTALPNLARSYLSVKELMKRENPHRSREAVVRLASSLTEAMSALDDIGVEQTIAVSVLLDKAHSASAPKSLIVFRNSMEQVRNAATRWTDAYKPTDRRPRNRALETHVGALMLLFEKMTGKRPTAALKRAGSHDPRLTSPGAQAIGSLLLSIDAKLTETAIANKIVQIGKEWTGRPLSHFAPMLLAGAPVYAVT
jgi:hypothetical protein